MVSWTEREVQLIQADRQQIGEALPASAEPQRPQQGVVNGGVIGDAHGWEEWLFTATRLHGGHRVWDNDVHGARVAAVFAGRRGAEPCRRPAPASDSPKV